MFSQDPKSSQDDGFKPLSDSGKKVNEDPSKESECKYQEQADNVKALTITFNFLSDHKDDDKEADINNMDITIQVSPTPITITHKDHPLD
nr:hypothetical protein [Tanacetum cinerariifolium]